MATSTQKGMRRNRPEKEYKGGVKLYIAQGPNMLSLAKQRLQIQLGNFFTRRIRSETTTVPGIAFAVTSI